MRIRSHLGSCFEVWNGEQTWFWFVANAHRNGGAIGAAATEAEAIREACSSIEEISARCRAGLTGLIVKARNVYVHPLRRSNSITLPVIGWESSLANLERYLTSVCGATS
jgi:hypothetical protein